MRRRLTGNRRASEPPPSPPEELPTTPDITLSYAAAGEVIDFFGGDNISFAGRRVADIGCGTGVMDVAVAQKAEPELLVGFDLLPVDTETLLSRMREHGLASRLPRNLRFEQCGEDWLPAEDDSFDYVFSWSAFEHIARPLPVLKEVRRVLRPHGVLMIQLVPFFHSRDGSHLAEWFPEGFVQLLRSPEEVEREVRSNPKKSKPWTDALLAAYRELNRITLDDLHRYLLAAGFAVAKLELLSDPVHLPMELAHMPLSVVGISGVKLLAVPR